MKKVIANVLMLLFILSGCSSANEHEDEDLIFDFPTYSIAILVTDASGNNLLDPKTPHNLLEEEIKVIYAGKEFKRIDANQPATRANMPAPLALRTSSKISGKPIVLSFGDFSPIKNYHSESFTIQWPDGAEDAIMFDLYITWESKNDPKLHFACYLNGEKWDTSKPITIIRP